MVNTSLALLERPDTPLDSVISSNYDATPAEVRAWVSG
jgi:hypothetical protein